MRVWITSFLVLFGMAELYQWVKHFTLPLPVYILGGAFLAIASNYERRGGFSFVESDDQQTDTNNQTTDAMPATNPPNFSSLSQSHAKLAEPASSNDQAAKPISFTIRQSTKQRIERGKKDKGTVAKRRDRSGQGDKESS